MLLQIRNIWGKQEDEGVKPCAVLAPPDDFLAQVASRCHLPKESMASFPATQPEREKPKMPEAAVPVKQPLTGQKLEEFMAKGYGLEGRSAQSTMSFLSDREIMRRTVLRGKPKALWHWGS